MRLLVADDDRESLRILELVLASEPFELLSASDGHAALRHILSERPPDIAILDWMMPGLSGLEVCKRIREIESKHYTYVVLLTARTHSEDLISGLEAGADDFVIKPFNPRELLLRIRSGQRVLELQKQLEDYSDFLQDLNYALAHDLKTPLVAINLTTQQALDGLFGELPERLESILEKTRNSVEILLRMTDSIRTLARHDSTNVESTMQEVDFQALVAACRAELEPLLRQRSLSVDITSSCPDRDDYGVIGNSQDLRRVILNLLDNAIKYSPTSGRIEISLMVRDDWLSCSIRDEGPGIPQADRPFLFQRFSTRSGQRRGSGTGLGLFVCKRILEAHHGSIIYDADDEGKDSFIVRLPRNPLKSALKDFRNDRRPSRPSPE